MVAGADAITLRDLRQRCEALAEDLARRGVPPEAHAEHAPGAVLNADEGAEGWLHYFVQLQRRHALAVAGEQAATGAGASAAIDDALAAAAAEEPVLVAFDDGHLRAVYPKSYHALRWLDSLDRQMVDAAAAAARLQEVRAALQEAGEATPPADAQAIARAPLVEALAVRLWLWVLTHEGPGLPFDDAGPEPTPPAWTREATPNDLLRAAEAHLTVNALRLATIGRAFPPEGGKAESRLRLAGFIASQAQEMGRPASDLMRRWSLGQLFAQAIARGEAEREARRSAEARRPAAASHAGAG